jgi:cytochrome oxidase Cu insertion factor (SCO1/SenC/PrrC family)
LLDEVLQVFLSVVFYIATFVISGCAKAPPPVIRALPDFSVVATSADGSVRPLTLASLQGRVWVADFVYTRCQGPCPMLTAHMAGLQKSLPERIGLLSFTVDPDHDTPKVLARYADRFGAKPGRWLFATGDKSALARLFREGFLISATADPKAAPGQYVAHTTEVVLIDARGRIRGYYHGDDPAALDRLSADALRL